MWHVTLKGLAARKFRLLLTSISIVLGVGFVAGALVFTDTLGQVFDHLFSQVTSGQDAVVRARLPFKVNVQGGGSQADRAPVPASLLGEVRTTPGVAEAAGSVGGVALVVGRDGKAVQSQAPSLGVSWGTAPRLNQAFNLRSGTRPTGPGQVALDETTASKAGVKTGDPVRIVFLSVPPETFKVSGVFRFGDAGNLAGATLAAFDPATAQRVLGKVGQWDQINVAAAPGVSQQEMASRLNARLSRLGVAAHYEAVTAGTVANENSDNVKQGLSFFGDFLLVFALIALFVGAFSIYNTFSIVVAQRAREFGLLRAVGASGRQVTRSVSLEAAVLGLSSSVIGLGFGIAVAIALQAILRAFGLDLPSGGIVIRARTVIVALVVGTVITLISARAPARRASRVSPVAALHDQTGAPSSGRRRFVVGGALAVVGLGLMLFGLFGNVSSSSVPGGGAGIVGAAAFLIFIGMAMLSPLVAAPTARALGWPSARLSGITGELARQNAMRNPRRTASTAAALMIGLALVTFVSIFGASAKSSFSAAVDRTNRADFQLASSNFAGFSPEAATAVRAAVPGSSVVDFRSGSWQLHGTTKQLVGAPATLQDVVDIKLRPGADLAAFATSGVLVYKNEADQYGWKVGDVVPMSFSATGTRPEVVRGIFDDNQGLGVSFAGYLLALRSYEANFTTQLDTSAAVRLPPGTAASGARTTIEHALTPFPNVKVQDETQAKAAQVSQFNTILNLMYALLLFAVIIALVGIVNTLVLSIYERTHEIGLLRAVGMSRRQTRAMIRAESVIISTFGAVMGVVVGVVLGRVIVASLHKNGVSFAVPYTQLVIFIVLAVLAGLLAGVAPARRAAHVDVLQAIATQ